MLSARCGSRLFGSSNVVAKLSLCLRGTHPLSGHSLDDIELTHEQRDIKDMARDFAIEELQPHGAQWDLREEFPVSTLQKAAGLGFAGIFVSEDVGGAGLSRFDGALIFESLAYGDVPATAYLTIHNMVGSVIDRFASRELRKKYLPDLVTMHKLASYCLTEPGSGSDAASLKTTARKQGDKYILNGAKAFISGGGASHVYLVMARTGDSESGPKGISAFLVDKEMPGVSFGKHEEKMGWRCQPTCTVSFDNVEVPAANLVGQEGDGFKIAMAALDGGRINIAACSVGGAQFCLDYARRYAEERHQFGKTIGSFQATEFKVADMATMLHASRLMVYHAAKTLDAKAPSATLSAAMAKRFATDSCYQVADGCLQILGGYGYLRDHPLERYVRDLRVHSILEGTNEVMRLIVSKQLQRLHPV